VTTVRVRIYTHDAATHHTRWQRPRVQWYPGRSTTLIKQETVSTKSVTLYPMTDARPYQTHQTTEQEQQSPSQQQLGQLEVTGRNDANKNLGYALTIDNLCMQCNGRNYSGMKFLYNTWRSLLLDLQIC
jgi:hypothetical protein